MSNPIEWEEKVETTRRVQLRVECAKGAPLFGGTFNERPATLDDLRKACEAVGLHSLLLAQLSAAEALTTSQACSRVATETRAVGLMAENGELRSALRQALNVGLAECERLRGEVNSAVHETDMRRAWALDPLRQPGESRADCARRLATERDAAIARAEKAEALHSKAEAEISCRNEMRARIAELETALANAANGIGFGEAGPAVYAANARHDEAAREWEDERAELVRTRQETQDKLSEARKELHELRARLAAHNARVDGEPVKGEPSLYEMHNCWTSQPGCVGSMCYHSEAAVVAEFAIAQWRAGHAAAAKPTRDLPRATSREVEAMADEAYRARTGMSPTMGDMRALAANVAERVRREQCLVTRAVEMGEGLNVVPGSKGRWYVTVKMGEQNCAPSDVARVLSEMLGEVK